MSAPANEPPRQATELANDAPHALNSPVNSPGFVGGFCVCEDGAMPSNRSYSAEVRERSVRLGFDHRVEFASD